MDPAALRKLRRTCSSSTVKVVGIVGGTHGNETNGVYLAKHFMKSPEVVARPSFDTKVILSNVNSIKANSRYTETDMNRCFLLKDLEDRSVVTTYEQRRAKEIDQILGPKSSTTPVADFIFDLHNTTAGTGIALLMAPDDDFAHEIGAFLTTIDPSVILCQWSPNDDWSMLPTIARSGMTFEVGPTPWGALDPALYRQSRQLLLAGLDYIQAHNTSLSGGKRGRTTEVKVPVFKRLCQIDYPREENGDLLAMVHPDLQCSDFKEIKDGSPLFLNLDCTTRMFSKQEHGIESDVAVYPFFVNEAAYYEKGIALMLATMEYNTYTIVNTAV
jgi:succinylglutamate desuccinylase